VAFIDACSSQNKNCIVGGYLMNCVRNRMFVIVKYPFPVCGHDFMTSDRMFGLREKVRIFRKLKVTE
jgi:hypothetical protein